METLFGHADWGGGKGGGGSSSSKKSVPDEQSESASETFAGERALMRELAGVCAGLEVAAAGREEAVGLLAEIKRLELALAGAKLAVIGHVERVEAAEAQEAREAKARGMGPDVSAGKKTRGEERTIHDTLTKEGKQCRAKTTREIRKARALEVFPLFGKVVREGRLSSDYVMALESGVHKSQIGQVQEDEAWFLEQALGESVDEFRKTIKVWLVTHHPERAVDSARRQARHEKFSVFPDGDGYRLAGWLGAMNGTILTDVMRSAVGVPRRDDDRSWELRNAQALMDLVESGANVARGNVEVVESGVAGGGALRAGIPDVGVDGQRAGVPLANVLGGGSESGGSGANVSGGGIPGFAAVRPGRDVTPRHQIIVTVPLDTLVQTEKAIDSGCRELERAGDESEYLEGDLRREEGTGGERWRASGGSGAGGGAEFGGCAESGGDTAGRCGTSGAGLGRHGQCLDVREKLTQDLGEVLAVIRAGFDSAMMAGHAPGVLPDGRPVAPSRLAALLCDSDIARVVLSSHSEPIDISRKQRLFSARQVRAVRARDRRCRYPGCERGPELCQVHHVQEHERGGPTTIDNAVLMCFHHHDYIHDEQITVAHHSGGFVFSAKDGNVIGVSRNETYARRAQARSEAA